MKMLVAIGRRIRRMESGPRFARLCLVLDDLFKRDDRLVEREHLILRDSERVPQILLDELLIGAMIERLLRILCTLKSGLVL